MEPSLMPTVFVLFVTWWVHSSLLLGGAAVLSIWHRTMRPRSREWLWKAAVVLPWLTAPLQCGWQSGFAIWQWELAPQSVEAVPPNVLKPLSPIDSPKHSDRPIAKAEEKTDWQIEIIPADPPAIAEKPRASSKSRRSLPKPAFPVRETEAVAESPPLELPRTVSASRPAEMFPRGQNRIIERSTRGCPGDRSTPRISPAMALVCAGVCGNGAGDRSLGRMPVGVVVGVDDADYQPIPRAFDATGPPRIASADPAVRETDRDSIGGVGGNLNSRRRGFVAAGDLAALRCRIEISTGGIAGAARARVGPSYARGCVVVVAGTGRLPRVALAAFQLLGGQAVAASGGALVRRLGRQPRHQPNRLGEIPHHSGPIAADANGHRPRRHERRLATRRPRGAIARSHLERDAGSRSPPHAVAHGPVGVLHDRRFPWDCSALRDNEAGADAKRARPRSKGRILDHGDSRHRLSNSKQKSSLGDHHSTRRCGRTRNHRKRFGAGDPIARSRR